jgi:hypothetical protein
LVKFLFCKNKGGLYSFGVLYFFLNSLFLKFRLKSLYDWQGTNVPIRYFYFCYDRCSLELFVWGKTSINECGVSLDEITSSRLQLAEKEEVLYGKTATSGDRALLLIRNEIIESEKSKYFIFIFCLITFPLQIEAGEKEDYAEADRLTQLIETLRSRENALQKGKEELSNEFSARLMSFFLFL